MTKYILHGGGTRVDNKSNRSFFQEIAKDVPDGGTILLVYFAVIDGDHEEHFRNMKEDFIKNSGDKKLNFILATEENFTEQIKDADAIYIHGGDTPTLLRKLSTFPNFADLIKGKVIAGSSAGAQILSTYFQRSQTLEIMEGFGILPIRFIPHYKSPSFNVDEEAVEKMNKYPNNLELVVLKDYEWKVFEK